eukprot:2581279-Pleurochrysis_carterae.AAC.4
MPANCRLDLPSVLPIAGHHTPISQGVRNIAFDGARTASHPRSIPAGPIGETLAPSSRVGKGEALAPAGVQATESMPSNSSAKTHRDRASQVSLPGHAQTAELQTSLRRCETVRAS